MGCGETCQVVMVTGINQFCPSVFESWKTGFRRVVRNDNTKQLRRVKVAGKIFLKCRSCHKSEKKCSKKKVQPSVTLEGQNAQPCQISFSNSPKLKRKSEATMFWLSLEPTRSVCVFCVARSKRRSDCLRLLEQTTQSTYRAVSAPPLLSMWNYNAARPTDFCAAYCMLGIIKSDLSRGWVLFCWKLACSRGRYKYSPRRRRPTFFFPPWIPVGHECSVLFSFCINWRRHTALIVSSVGDGAILVGGRALEVFLLFPAAGRALFIFVFTCFSASSTQAASRMLPRTALAVIGMTPLELKPQLPPFSRRR